ncbi:MAG: HDIG domain-containing protein [candidate division KSB1 bacterium]|nr:HDIG domain-containing protein [candidate division KSB1 bacterium]MDZ7302915.1 HDIG domain-containing protein [candidate division KSB1 bacterium]MDZ7310490.1 HDIG domain-containing protein [candidate division KSB1 bacterium]
MSRPRIFSILIKIFSHKTKDFRSSERSRRVSIRLVDFWRKHRWQVFIAVLFVLTGVLLFPVGKSFQFADLREGEIYEGDEIIAPFTFSIDKTPEEYQRDVRIAQESVYPVFVRNDSIEMRQRQALGEFLAALEQNIEALVPDSMKIRRLQELFAAQSKLIISEEGLRFLTRSFVRGSSAPTSGWRFENYAGQLKRIARDLYAVGILERHVVPAYVQKISVRRGPNEMVEAIDQFYWTTSVNDVVLQKLREVENLSEPAVNIGYQILTNFLSPNLIYEAQETDQRIKQAVALVPRARGTVLAKERIIDSHDKITQEHLQKLRSLATEMARRRASQGGIHWLLPILGRVAILLVGVGITGIFLLLYHPAIYHDAQRVLLIALILLLVIFIGRLIHVVGLSEYLIPVAMAPMLLTFFFNAQVAFVGTVTLGVILGAMRGYEFGMIFTTLIVGSFSILAVRRVRSRNWIFKAILMLAAAYLATIATTAFLRIAPFKQTLLDLRDGILLNALLCPIFTYGLMVIFEYLFDLTTDATLLELSALNRPLLRELAIQAPGTYHHSIIVGTLSEAAAEAIGANSLLARVGSYYHDIGKIEMAEYFVENQRGGKNPHEKLTPNMSLLVIINHVKRGLEIAEENNIPKEVRDFIPEHHGTNLISYFYKKALEKNDDSEVHESDFRYPGPKPQTKETGIVMLADAVEAACRALRDPSISRLRNMVNSIVEDRFKKGELDECPLTLRDLNLIKDSFVRTLTGIFHGRAQYAETSKTTGKNTKTSEASRTTPAATPTPQRTTQSSSSKTRSSPATTADPENIGAVIAPSPVATPADAHEA